MSIFLSPAEKMLLRQACHAMQVLHMSKTSRDRQEAQAALDALIAELTSEAHTTADIIAAVRAYTDEMHAVQNSLRRAAGAGNDAAITVAIIEYVRFSSSTFGVTQAEAERDAATLMTMPLSS